MDANPDSATLSPLKRHFLKLLLSPDSATRIDSHTPEIAVMAVTLDLLRASLECWATFFSDLARELHKLSNKREWLLSHQSPSIRSMPDFVSRLQLNLRHTYACFLAEIEDVANADLARLRSLEREIDAKLDVVQLQSRHWLDLIETMASITAAYTDEVQAQSVKRLSLLAAIFLPISLASGLLSMNVRAADLGPLWYDYFGLAIVAMSLVALLYLCLWTWDEVQVLEFGTLKNLVGAIRMIFRLVQHIVRSKWRAANTFVLYCFGAAIVTSFCIGMARDITLGLHIFGFSAIGFVTVTVLLHILELLEWVYKYVSAEMKKSTSENGV